MWHIQFRILPVRLLLDRCWSVSPFCLLMCHFPESCSSCWHPWKSSDSKMTHFFMWSLSSWDWAVYALNWLLNCGDVVAQESLSGLAVCSVVWTEWITEAESMGAASCLSSVRSEPYTQGGSDFKAKLSGHQLMPATSLRYCNVFCWCYEYSEHGYPRQGLEEVACWLSTVWVSEFRWPVSQSRFLCFRSQSNLWHNH